MIFIPKSQKEKKAEKRIMFYGKLFLFIWIIAAIVSNKNDSQHVDIKPVKTSINKVLKRKVITINPEYNKLASYEHIIKKFEGYKRKPYLCKGGFLTVGYGTRVYSKFDLQKSHIALLQRDIKKHINIVNQAVKVKLHKKQHVALVSLSYNIGENAFKNSKLVACVNKGNKACIAREFKAWIYAKGQKLKGLEKRRNAEYRLFVGAI